MLAPFARQLRRIYLAIPLIGSVALSGDASSQGLGQVSDPLRPQAQDIRLSAPAGPLTARSSFAHSVEQDSAGRGSYWLEGALVGGAATAAAFWIAFSLSFEGDVSGSDRRFGLKEATQFLSLTAVAAFPGFIVGGLLGSTQPKGKTARGGEASENDRNRRREAGGR